jgi:hypothetical protein
MAIRSRSDQLSLTVPYAAGSPSSLGGPAILRANDIERPENPAGMRSIPGFCAVRQWAHARMTGGVHTTAKRASGRRTRAGLPPSRDGRFRRRAAI